MRFRPCIDLRDGKVVQIVGSTLTDQSGPTVNFESTLDSAVYAERFRHDGLLGGHVIALGEGNRTAAMRALGAFPGGMQYGGGITPASAVEFLDAGASHVIATSFLFTGQRFDWEKLRALSKSVGARRLVVDLSCARRQGHYVVMTNRWRDATDIRIEADLLRRIAVFCAEFLIHAVDVEGKQSGVESELIARLAAIEACPVTYAGGVRSVADLEQVRSSGNGRIDVTVGSALDIYGGRLPYTSVLEWFRAAR